MTLAARCVLCTLRRLAIHNKRCLVCVRVLRPTIADSQCKTSLALLLYCGYHFRRSTGDMHLRALDAHKEEGLSKRTHTPAFSIAGSRYRIYLEV